jgi:hypothetical protein
MREVLDVILRWEEGGSWVRHAGRVVDVQRRCRGKGWRRWDGNNRRLWRDGQRVVIEGSAEGFASSTSSHACVGGSWSWSRSGKAAVSNRLASSSSLCRTLRCGVEQVPLVVHLVLLVLRLVGGGGPSFCFTSTLPPLSSRNDTKTGCFRVQIIIHYWPDREKTHVINNIMSMW